MAFNYSLSLQNLIDFSENVTSITFKNKNILYNEKPSNANSKLISESIKNLFKPNWFLNYENTYENGPSHELSGESLFVGGVLAPNEKIILVPLTSSNIGIYDPITNTYENGPSYNGFAGGVLAPNGKIILVPFNSTTIGIYDPITNTYEIGPSCTGFVGGVLAPNGKIILVPFNSENIGIYGSKVILENKKINLTPYFNKF